MILNKLLQQGNQFTLNLSMSDSIGREFCLTTKIYEKTFTDYLKKRNKKLCKMLFLEPWLLECAEILCTKLITAKEMKDYVDELEVLELERKLKRK